MDTDSTVLTIPNTEQNLNQDEQNRADSDAQDSVPASVKDGRPHWLITSETAKAMAAKAVEARRAKASIPRPNGQESIPSVEPSQPTFVSEQLPRVRAELVRLQGLAEKLTEPIDIERMNRAIGVLAERERILAGRPLPGSHRPTNRRTRGRQQAEEC